MAALALFGDSYLYATLPIHYAEAGVSLVAVGWLLSVNRWIRFFTNPLAGAVGARLGWATAFAGALWLGALTTVGYGLLSGLVLLTLLRALWGLSWSFLRLGGVAAVLADSPLGKRGRNTGLFTGIYRLGSLVGVLAGGVLADRLGFGPTAVVLGAATAVGAVVASLPPAVAGRWGAPGRTEVRRAAAAGAGPGVALGAGAASAASPGAAPASPGAASAASPGAAPASPGTVLARGARLAAGWVPRGHLEWVACLAGASLQLIVSGLVTGTGGLLLKERLGAQIGVGPWVLGVSTLAGLLLGSRFLLDLLVGPALGHWADRFGREKLLAVLAAVLPLALVGLGWAASLWAIMAAALVLFAAGSGLATLLDAWAGDIAGVTPGRFLPMYATWQDVGAALGPILAYPLIDGLGLAVTYGVGSAFFLLVAAICLWFSRRPAGGGMARS
jgi:MFS family permease